jgi:hypothetical protein
MLVKPQLTGPGKKVTFKRRKQKRNKTRVLESVDQDWAHWDEAAKAEGVNWSEFTRRALHVRAREVLGVGRASK